jgi:transcriptional regulator with XRE-family HTH domain
MRHDLKECGKRIQQFRKERGLTQEQLAEKLNVSENTIAKIESGLRRPSIDFLLELSDFFGVSTNYLVLGIHPEDMGGSLNEKIDEAITQIDSTIEKLLIKREELLKMKSELE